ncbi:TetR/AcrR family transcriptional regulator [Natrarchaeobaculum aegyptiacum]|uniref:Transcriptional regulator n=1 Tax=Natrarchaeobaculum aegyptiacum TaxID=745377 RepID=A0A2Z2HWV1_9EURY|nr:TetR/AcrR family transcriptional regulator [Natrarchaeobaculum aegyptiacum]ARS89434.1 transcriptional regulator [Natrarchaeobaculum aegyptiacum]
MRGFSDDERERITEALVEAGQRQFAQFGLERTRIKDITDEVDIGTSTFYQFFDSKEELYVEVLLREHRAFHTAAEEAVEDVDEPREQARAVLQTMFEEVESNPLIYRLIVEGELRSLQSRLSDAERAEIVDSIRGRRLSTLEEWVDDPAFRIDDREMVDALLRKLVFVSRAKNIPVAANTGPEYEETRDVLIDVVVNGLFSEPRDGDR